MGKKKKKSESRLKEATRLDLSDGAKRGIVAVILLAVALVMLLSFFDIAGSVGQLLNRATRQLFGWGGFAVPLVLLVVSFSFFKSGETKVYRTATAGMVLFLLSFLGVLFATTDITEMIAVAQDGRGGGFVGMMLGYPLQYLFGPIAATVLLILFMVIGAIVAVNISIEDIREKWYEFRERRANGGDDDEDEEYDEDEDEEPEPRRAAPKLKVTSIGSKLKKAPANGSVPFKASELRSQMYQPDTDWELPGATLFEGVDTEPVSGDVEKNAEIIRQTFEQFGIEVAMHDVSVGPTVTQFTLKPSEGIKLSRITGLSDDLALALAAHPLRIEAPIPGKSLVGVEIPNKQIALVHLGNVLQDKIFAKAKDNLVVGLGRDVAGSVVTANIEKMPHMLVAGATGSGKSVCMNTIISSLLVRNSPRQLKMLMIDPKRVELTSYNGIPHLLTPVITDPQKAVNALQWAIGEMDRRYKLLEEAGSRNIFSYNSKTKQPEEKLPFMVIIVDELADLMVVKGKEVEAAIVRIAQMARAVGMHLILSTQRPSVDVLTGLIKANIPTRVAFQVPTQIDSRTILDSGGAETLLGNGDMLYLSNESKTAVRLQGAFLSESDVSTLVNFWVEQVKEKLGEDYSEQQENSDITEPVRNLAIPGFSGGGDDGISSEDVEMYEQAKQVVQESGKASASFLQRRLRIGYARAARMIDLLEEQGVVGPASGSKPREVLIGADDETTYDDAVEDDERRSNWEA